MKIFIYALAVQGFLKSSALECYSVSGLQADYNGTKTTTISGITCQRWDKHYPHAHRFADAQRFPDESLAAAENFCRDPFSFGFPWCFTTDPKIVRMSCGIPPCSVHQCFSVVNGKVKYTGKKRTTYLGDSCQEWDSQFPHQHIFTNPSSFPEKNLTAAENFCRDPDGKGFPWCIPKTGNSEWIRCGVAKCYEGDCYNLLNGYTMYSGQKQITETGLTCARWDQLSPNKQKYQNPDTFPDSSLTAAENFCRDPINLGFPWCFTLDPFRIWESCGIPLCAARYSEDNNEAITFLIMLAVTSVILGSIVFIYVVISRKRRALEQTLQNRMRRISELFPNLFKQGESEEGSIEDTEETSTVVKMDTPEAGRDFGEHINMKENLGYSGSSELVDDDKRTDEMIRSCLTTDQCLSYTSSSELGSDEKSDKARHDLPESPELGEMRFDSSLDSPRENRVSADDKDQDESNTEEKVDYSETQY